MRIESVCAVGHAGGAVPSSSRALAARVARGCLEVVGGEGVPVPLVLYTGVYRDDSVVEPAQAPFVQQALGAAGGRSDAQPEGGFSFDVDSLLAALEIADGMMRSRRLSRALVVAVDGGEMPSDGVSDAVAAAAGMIVGPGDADEGFAAWYTKALPEHRDLRGTHLSWTQGNGSGAGRHVMVVAESPGYLDACVSSAAGALSEFLSEMGVGAGAGLLVLPSQAPLGFPERLRERLGLSAEQVVDVSNGRGAVHSAGPVAALDVALRDGRFARAANVVWLTVQPGLVISAALYRNRGRAPRYADL